MSFYDIDILLRLLLMRKALVHPSVFCAQPCPTIGIIQDSANLWDILYLLFQVSMVTLMSDFNFINEDYVFNSEAKIHDFTS